MTDRTPQRPTPPSICHDSAAVARTALVTGAATRLGRDIALGLARSGWDIAVHFHRSADQASETVRSIRALGRQAHGLAADLSRQADVVSLFERARSALGGRLGLVVNNASHFEFDDPASASYELLESHMAPNVAAAVTLTRLLHASLPATACGVVINLLDQKLRNLNPDFFSYTLSKAALETATHLCAQALAPKLRVVGVSPGITLPSGGQTRDQFEAAHRMTPLGRSSESADVVAAVVYLADARAVSGINLLVDGAQHLASHPRDVMYLTEGSAG